MIKKRIITSLIAVAAAFAIMYISHHVSYWSYINAVGGEISETSCERHLSLEESNELGYTFKKAPFERLHTVYTITVSGPFVNREVVTTSKGYFYNKK